MKVTTRWLAVATGVAGTAGLGSLASTRGVETLWYRRLDKPPFQPPSRGLPGRLDTALRRRRNGRRRRPGPVRGPRSRTIRAGVAVNLTMNAGGSWVFFRWHRLGPAVVVATALTASSADLVRRTHKVAPGHVLALATYPAWCGFATVLSAAIWRCNR